MDHIDKEATLDEVLENLTLGEGLRKAREILLAWLFISAFLVGCTFLPRWDFTYSGLFENGVFGVPFPLVIFVVAWLGFRFWPTSFHQFHDEGFYFPRLKAFGSTVAAANATAAIYLVWRSWHYLDAVPLAAQDRAVEAVNTAAALLSFLPIWLFISIINVGHENLMSRRRHGGS